MATVNYPSPVPTTTCKVPRVLSGDVLFLNELVFTFITTLWTEYGNF